MTDKAKRLRPLSSLSFSQRADAMLSMTKIVTKIEEAYRRSKTPEEMVYWMPLPTDELRRWADAGMDVFMPMHKHEDACHIAMGFAIGLLVAARNQVSLDTIDV